MWFVPLILGVLRTWWLEDISLWMCFFKKKSSVSKFGEKWAVRFMGDIISNHSRKYLFFEKSSLNWNSLWVLLLDANDQIHYTCQCRCHCRRSACFCPGETAATLCLITVWSWGSHANSRGMKQWIKHITHFPQFLYVSGPCLLYEVWICEKLENTYQYNYRIVWFYVDLD